MKNKKYSNTNSSLLSTGYSIIEMLVSVALLVIVMIVATQSIASSLKNSRKSDSISKVRENVDYVISSMERLLRNAQSRSCISPQQLNYVDEYGNTTNFSCITSGGYSYIASGSAATKLTSSNVSVNCSSVFSCPTPAAGVPQSVIIKITASEYPSVGADGATVTSQTRMQLRSYGQF